MAKPDTLIIDGRAYSWQRLRALRQAQIVAWKAAQPGNRRYQGRLPPAGRVHRVRPLPRLFDR